MFPGLFGKTNLDNSGRISIGRLARPHTNQNRIFELLSCSGKRVQNQRVTFVSFPPTYKQNQGSTYAKLTTKPLSITVVSIINPIPDNRYCIRLAACFKKGFFVMGMNQQAIRLLVEQEINF